MHCKEEITIFYNIGTKKYSLEKSTTKKLGGGQDEKKYLQFILQRVNCLNIQRALTNQQERDQPIQ